MSFCQHDAASPVGAPLAASQDDGAFPVRIPERTKLSNRSVATHFGGVLTSLKKYRAIWGIAAIVSQYRAIWCH